MPGKNIPFNIFPLPVMRQIASNFLGIGSTLSRSFPKLSQQLRQAEIQLFSDEYLAIAFVLFMFWAFFGAFVAFVFAYKFDPSKALPLAFIVGLLFGSLVLLQVIIYPTILIKRKVRNIERNLVFALRTIAMQLTSGVSLFSSMKLIADGEYGKVSEIFSKGVSEINVGAHEKEILEQMAEDNPSLFFRRAIWQITNGLRAGADVSAVMKASVDMLTKEQAIQIRRYGSQLRVLSLVYMMLGVIVPALGLTFLIVLSSFPQIEIQETFFWGLLAFILVGEFMFLGLVKSKRPALIGET